MDVKQEYGQTLKDLASTMLDVARESVTLMKRSDQALALKWSRTQEWDIYLEFLKVMFNIVDRLSAFHIPLQAQPEFMDLLEDAVAERLKTVLAPSLTSAEIDDMEIILSIGNTVAESRQLYEPYKFIISEDSKEKEAYFQLLGGQVASKAGAANSQHIVTSAILCGQAVVPAMQALFENIHAPREPETEVPAKASTSTETAAADPAPAAPSPSPPTSQTIKLVSVMGKVSGEEVETWWGVLPRFQQDLLKDESRQLALHMNRVARILGERFAVLTSLTSTSSDEQTEQA